MISNETDIIQMDFTVRTWNCLRKAGINTVGELRKKSQEELLEIKGLGKTSLEDIVKHMAKKGYIIVKI